MPRPPETMTFAAVSSGRSDFENSRLTKAERPASAGGETGSTGAEPPLAGAASKAVVRTVMTLTGSADFTVASALPA